VEAKSRIRNYLLALIVALGLSIDRRALAARGLFPKMPPAMKVYVVDCLKNSADSKTTAFALQGLINQSSAEIFIQAQSFSLQQLRYTGRPNEMLNTIHGDDSGLMNLFQKYQAQVKKMFVYDPEKSWTWCVGLMLGAQQQGIPVTESIKDELIAKFGWKGEVVDLRDRWPDAITAYDWALANLMPNCTKQVVFTPRYGMSIIDYVVASKGFAFGLNFKDPTELQEVKRIFGTPGYGVGTSLMSGLAHFARARRGD